MLYFKEGNKVEGYRVEATDKKGVEDVLKEELDFVRHTSIPNYEDEAFMKKQKKSNEPYTKEEIEFFMQTPSNVDRIVIGGLESNSPFTIATAAPFVEGDRRKLPYDIQRIYLEGIESKLGASYREQLINLLHQDVFRMSLVSVLKSMNNPCISARLANDNPDIVAFRKLLPFIRLVLEREYDVSFEKERIQKESLKEIDFESNFSDILQESVVPFRTDRSNQMSKLNRQISVAETNSAVENMLKLDFRKTK